MEYIWMMAHVATYIQLNGPERRLIEELNNEMTDWKFIFNGRLYGENNKRNLKFQMEFPPEIKYFQIFKEKVKEYLTNKTTPDAPMFP